MIARIHRDPVMQPALRILAVALASCCCLAAADVELVLRSGKIVRGQLVAEEGGRVTVRQRLMGKNGSTTMEATYSVDEVLKRTAVKPPEELYAEKAAKCDASLRGRCQLAQWCWENQLPEKAVAHCKEAFAIDPTEPWARRIMEQLGWAEINGSWVVEADYLATNKLARFDGRYMPAPEAEARAALAKARAAREQAQKDLDAAKDGKDRKPRESAEWDQKAKSAEAAAKPLDEQAKKIREELAALRKQQSERTKPPSNELAAKEAKQKSDGEKQASELETRARRARDEAKESARKRDAAKAAAEHADADLADAQKRQAAADAEIKACQDKLAAMGAEAK